MNREHRGTSSLLSDTLWFWQINDSSESKVIDGMHPKMGTSCAIAIAMVKRDFLLVLFTHSGTLQHLICSPLPLCLLWSFLLNVQYTVSLDLLIWFGLVSFSCVVFDLETPYGRYTQFLSFFFFLVFCFVFTNGSSIFLEMKNSSWKRWFLIRSLIRFKSLLAGARPTKAFWNVTTLITRAYENSHPCSQLAKPRSRSGKRTFPLLW